jgi:hypothetical protein
MKKNDANVTKGTMVLVRLGEQFATNENRLANGLEE